MTVTFMNAWNNYLWPTIILQDSKAITMPMLVANLKFLNSLSPEDYQVFKEAAALSTEVEMEEWDKSIEEAKKIATDEMSVEFIDVDVEAFKEKVLPLHESMLQENEKIRDLYDHIQAANEKAKGGQ